MTTRVHPLFAALLIASALLFSTERINAERLPLQIFTSADGLGSGFVDYIFRDSRGFMWFCTRDGLSRFDGARFVNYRIGSHTSPPGIESIFETSKGLYFVSTTGGSFRLKPDEPISPIDGSNSLAAEFLIGARGQFVEDSKGNIWITSGKPGKIVERDGKMEFEPFDLGIPPVPNVSFTNPDVVEGKDGSLWFSTSWGLVRVTENGARVFYPIDSRTIPGNTSMISDRSGLIWYTRGHKVYVIRPERSETIEGSTSLIYRSFSKAALSRLDDDGSILLPSSEGEIVEYVSSDTRGLTDGSYTRRLFESSDGTIWMTANNVLTEIAHGRVKTYDTTAGLPQVMSRMGEDLAGNLWIGGQSGLARLDRRGFRTYGQGTDFRSSRFFSIAPDSDGSPIFGGGDFTLSRFDGRRSLTVRPRVESDAQYLWTSRFAFRESNGDWWLLSNRKAHRYSGINRFEDLDRRRPTRVYGRDEGLRSDGAFQIFEDSKANIWISTRGTSGSGHGIAILRNGAERFQSFSEADGLPPQKSGACYVEDEKGRVWIGFYEGGLAIYDKGSFRILSTGDGLPQAGHVVDIHIDSSGTMWLATSTEGLYRVDRASDDSPRFERIALDPGTVSANIRTITEDSGGRLYLGTARGVYRFTPSSGHVAHFSVSDGLAADFVVDSYRDRNGDLWFATNNGVSRLTPTADSVMEPPPVYIGSIRISGQSSPVSELGALAINLGDLRHTDNSFQIGFFGIDLRAGELLRYQYKLLGSNEDWSEPSPTNSVTFANLNPGSYRFEVRAVSSDGLASSQAAAVIFVIVPPVWQRWWFMLIVCLVLAAVFYSIYRYRTNQLKQINAALAETRDAEERLSRSQADRLSELEKVRARIATDLHDDIGSSLTQIAILSEVAQARSGNGHSSIADPLGKITDLSNELVGTMSDIVWSINPVKDHLSDLTQRMRRFASDTLSAKDIKLQFDLAEPDREIIINSNMRREIFLIFKESINNIAKHSGAKNVTVLLRTNESGLELKVADDGRGFSTEIADREGNGLASIRRRARELGGTIEITSNQEMGVEVSLAVPFVQMRGA